MELADYRRERRRENLRAADGSLFNAQEFLRYAEEVGLAEQVAGMIHRVAQLLDADQATRRGVRT